MSNDIPGEILERSRSVKMLLMDCDGVLTDGKLYFSPQGEAMKVFHVRDGQGLALWHAAGFRSGIVSGRDAGDIIAKRAEELGIHHVIVKTADKAAELGRIISETGLSADQIAFIGDDVGDLEIMKQVGFPVAVADAADELFGVAAYVTKAKGGNGAVRELIDLLLTAKSQ
jgi:3-deoxy-D-manno-octulosonate 8-phosphate phosphatase (KDO 8-P phosphatase)